MLVNLNSGPSYLITTVPNIFFFAENKRIFMVVGSEKQMNDPQWGSSSHRRHSRSSRQKSFYDLNFLPCPGPCSNPSCSLAGPWEVELRPLPTIVIARIYWAHHRCALSCIYTIGQPSLRKRVRSPYTYFDLLQYSYPCMKKFQLTMAMVGNFSTHFLSAHFDL